MDQAMPKALRGDLIARWILAGLTLMGFGAAEAFAQGYALKAAASKMMVADGLDVNLLAGEQKARQTYLFHT